MSGICGKKNWVFPDAELPPAGRFELKGHESIIMLNMGDKPAHARMSLYFTDGEPYGPIGIEVGAKRVKCVRMDHPDELGGYDVERGTQYAIAIESDEPIVAQYGRLDTREQPMAFYINAGYCE